MAKTILILGGGTGGVVAANVLAKVLPKEHRIALVDRADRHVFLASLPLVATGERKPKQITRPLQRLEGPNLQFLQAEVQEFNPGDKTIRTDQGLLSYDSLIIALGAEQHGLLGHSLAFNPYKLDEAAALFLKLRDFRQGHIVIFVSSLPFIGAIAPYEIALLVDSFFRNRGLRRKIQISFVTPEHRLLAFASPHYSEKLSAIMHKRGIQVITDRAMHSLAKNGTSEHKEADIPGDLFIGIPHHKGPAPFKSSVIANGEGWLTVDPHTLATCLEDVYAVGDATAIESPSGTWIPKVGFFAHYQAEVVARNLALKYTNQAQRFSFVGGAAGASMLASFNRGCFVSVDAYARPPVMRLSRPNPLAYWTKMLFERYWLRSWF